MHIATVLRPGLRWALTLARSGFGVSSSGFRVRACGVLASSLADVSVAHTLNP